jgi:HemY protein
LRVAESWVKEHPNDAALALALGRLALRNRNWSQAREQFEASLHLDPSPAAQAELGRLCLALGDARGTDLLVAAFGELPALPLPTPGVLAEPA